AFRLCEEAKNKPLAAEMLAAMSHQAAFLRISDEAIDLALAARRAATEAGVPALIAEAAVMEAHGLALQGNTKACLTALRDAEDQFCRIHTDSTPGWLGYFDNAYLSAKFGHTLRDLGRPTDAERFARQSLQMTDGYERGRTFNMALLAGVLADKGDLDESVACAQQALQMAGNVRSTRTVAYMSDVAQRLEPFSQDTRVRSLYKNMTAHRIPIARID
ncbi:MAG: XRE family transcriptional regulator, partial [Sciscionella sp.]